MKKLFLFSTAVFAVASMGAVAMAEDNVQSGQAGLATGVVVALDAKNVPADFSAAACLIQKEGRFLLPMTEFKGKKEMSLPIRKKDFVEVEQMLDKAGVNRDDAGAVAAAVARAGAESELGLAMDKVHVKGIAGFLEAKRGGVMVMFNCETNATPEKALIKQQKVIDTQWLDPDTMKNDKGDDMPRFFKDGDREFLQVLKHQ